MASKNLLRDYFELSKPGIIGGNLLLSLAGFLLASGGHVDFSLLLKTLISVSLIIASACTANNIFDRDIDAKMKRTKSRALASGRLRLSQAYAYAALTGMLGLIILAASTNLITVTVGLIGYLDYVFVYSRLKHSSTNAALIGSLAGATPAVAGFTAASGQLSLGGWLLLAIFGLWQMPHFYAISIYRLKEYQAAGIPVLPLKIGVKATKQRIILYIWLFTFASLALGLAGYGGFSYLAVAFGSGLAWLYYGLIGCDAKSDTAWARSMFGLSLLIVLITCANLALANWLP